jgi:uracil-DNA glycosylase
MSQTIQKYQQDCWKQYKSDIGLPENYNYLYGNPVKVHVPVDVATGGLMIVGAYPTAQFNTINSINDVPVADHLYPFSNDTYFDGSRVRQVKSGEELEEFFLKKLEYQRNRCWITDLVKVFLFKEGHISKYNQLNYFGVTENRSDFVKLANLSLSYFSQEVELAKSKAILLLGEEVTSVVMNVSRSKANDLLQEGFQELEIEGEIYKVIASPHPGILMRGGDASEKWRKISNKQLDELKLFLSSC